MAGGGTESCIAPTNRPLTAKERQVVFDLATGVVAEHRASNVQTAAAALNQLAADGHLILYGDLKNAYLGVRGISELTLWVSRKPR